MKRYVCTVATGLLLALVSTGTATAIEPPPTPLSGQSGTQEATFGDQTAQQSNSADVDQIQGNGNLHIAPAIAVFGGAETTTVQGSGNEATANVGEGRLVLLQVREVRLWRPFVRRRRRDDDRPGQRRHGDRERRPVELGRPVADLVPAPVARRLVQGVGSWVATRRWHRPGFMPGRCSLDREETTCP